MRSMIAAFGMILLPAWVEAGQNGDPAPQVAAPSSTTEEIPTPSGTPEPQAWPSLTTEEIPTPSGTPEPQASPVLLPGPNQLPAQTPIIGPLQPPDPKGEAFDSRQTAEITKPLSPEEQARNKIRLAEIKEIAMRNARVGMVLKEANGALTDEAKREFMRAYYHTLCTRMRELDPSLNRTISEFERAEIRKLALGPSHLPIFAEVAPHKGHRRHAGEVESSTPGREFKRGGR
jgi:hypothetical protein